MSDDTHPLPLFLSIAAIFISLGAIYLQFFIHRREHGLSALSTNLASLADIDLMLASDSSLLRFHSVSADELTAHGVTEKDLAYLIATFHAGSIYYSTVDLRPTEEPFTESDPYRFHMMRSSATRRAWPLVERFLNDSNYKTRLRLTKLQFDVADQRAQGQLPP